MAEKGNEQSRKDAYKEYREAVRKYEAADNQCQAARRQANLFKWICFQPVPRGIHTVIVCAPYAGMTWRADWVCAPCEDLVVAYEKKYDEYSKLVLRQERQSKSRD